MENCRTPKIKRWPEGEHKPDTKDENLTVLLSTTNIKGEIDNNTIIARDFFLKILATPRGMRDPSVPTRDRSHGPCSGSVES